MCNNCEDLEKSDLIKGSIPKMIGNPKYKDAPRLPMIYDYEGEFKSNYNKSLKVMSTELAKKMISFVK
jgi:hypothetical protein